MMELGLENVRRQDPYRVGGLQSPGAGRNQVKMKGLAKIVSQEVH